MTQQQPSWLDDHSRQRISNAVAAAESNTAGEIVTILADQSDDYGDVALAWSALVAFAALTVISIWPEFYLSKLAWFRSSWNTEWTAAHAFAIATVVATLKFGSAWLLLLWRPLRLALVPGPVRKARVHERAIAAFRIGAERRTRGRTGILIYLSMREHRAEIVADETIATRVDPEVWGDALSAMLAELKQGQVAEGMCAAVDRVGAILAQHLPRDANDENELPDRLIEL
ncbi:hypothetical protein NT2_01_01470 [Caenibius tardaugens NBRC 16725]|uniref:TPM domain-containing protein n=1 Tax=Caenibius tardaugens NBRC 16725 TaxID=1219035 RepID=U2ZPU9_9SPHN|nr:TPM domain-containing protein [Caenibius tardaugens]AZI37361.1 hypothetical protein EGO55_16410 [Caenibius tardaugens NBRC 16725]GAD47379.1 hypothetical protein NT2_01_01470 [Caenibius tardaugens NBRC 16725]